VLRAFVKKHKKISKAKVDDDRDEKSFPSQEFASLIEKKKGEANGQAKNKLDVKSKKIAKL